MVAKMNLKNIFLSLILILFSSGLYAAPIIMDKADLLTDEEEALLSEEMDKISEAGGVAFVTNGANDSYSGDASDLAKKYCYDLFKGDSGTVFLIDMYNRRIEIYSTGDIYKLINGTRANGITDNVYEYATNKQYYECARSVFEQMSIVLDGGEIAIPMRYVTNLLMAIGIILFFTYLFTLKGRNAYNNKNTEEEIITPEGKKKISYLTIVKKKLTHEIKRTHSSGGSGGGSSGGGSSGGGGGGGGGGHSF